MSRRLDNFRKGDRAEDMGISMLKALCAVAKVPREEDFGLFDALATVLRREGPFVYAETSFLVQFKSRTETTIEYLDELFTCLVGQEVSVMIGKVDLTGGPRLDLYSLGPGLAHPNLSDCVGMVAHFEDYAGGPKDGLLHVRLDKPLLTWTTAQVDDSTFRDAAYQVLHEHLRLERENRHLRGYGQSRIIRWETNEVPTSGGTMMVSLAGEPARQLGQVVPGIQTLASFAFSDQELREPIRQIIRWLGTHGVDADPVGIFRHALDSSQISDRLCEALECVPEAEVAVTVQVVQVGRDFLNFWVCRRDRAGQGGARRHHGTLADLREEGFEVEVEIDGTQVAISLGLPDDYLGKGGLVEIEAVSDGSVPVVHGGVPEVFLFRKPAFDSNEK